VECLDSSEVFCTFYRGMLLYRGVFCPFLFEVWPSAVKPPSLVRTRSIRVLAIFYRSTLTLLFFKKRKRGGERRTTLVGRVPTVFGELLTGNSSGSPCSIQ
jgi:hypothetical protein